MVIFRSYVSLPQKPCSCTQKTLPAPIATSTDLLLHSPLLAGDVLGFIRKFAAANLFHGLCAFPTLRCSISEFWGMYRGILHFWTTV
jgi:hypothetical protein